MSLRPSSLNTPPPPVQPSSNNPAQPGPAHQVKKKAKRHRARVAHHTKGRMRIEVPTAKGDLEALEAIKRSLEPLVGVCEVTVNETTGSVTVHYDPKRHPDFHSHVSHSEGSHQENLQLHPPPPVVRGPITEVDEAIEMLEKEAEFLASHSHTAKALFDALRRFDIELKKATGNNLDLKVLTPLALAVYAFLELGFEAATPVWLTLGVFSFNHFVTLHTQTPTTHPKPPIAPHNP